MKEEKGYYSSRFFFVYARSCRIGFVQKMNREMSLIHSQVGPLSRKTFREGNIAGLVQSFSYGEALRKPLAPWPPLISKGKEVVHSLDVTCGDSRLQLAIPSKQ